MINIPCDLRRVQSVFEDSVKPYINEVNDYCGILQEAEMSRGDIDRIFKSAVKRRGDGEGALSKLSKMRDSSSSALAKLKVSATEIADKVKVEIENGSIDAASARKSFEKYFDTVMARAFGGASVDANKLGEDITASIVASTMKQYPMRVALSEYVLSEGPFDGLSGMISGAASKIGKKAGILDRGVVQVSDLYNAWIAAGKPTDSDEIEDILKTVGFDSGEINAAFKATGVSRSADYDPNVVKLAKLVKANGLEKFVIKYLERFGVTESVELHERKIADSDIKALFTKLLTSELPKARDDHYAANSFAQKYVNKWAKEMKRVDIGDEIPRGYTIKHDGSEYEWMGLLWRDKRIKRIAKKEVARELTDTVMDTLNKPKIALIREIVNFMADRHGSVEWKQVLSDINRIISGASLPQEVRGTAMNRIRDGLTMESSMFHVVNTLLNESGFTWGDIGYDPRNASDGIEELRPMFRDGVLYEGLFSEIVEAHAYGRNRKR